MRLVDASRYFDDTVVRDAYTNVALFKGQSSSYLNTQATGTVSSNRILSLATSLVIPTRRTVKLSGEVWIVGDGTKDSLQGTDLRTNYSIRRAPDAFKILTPAQAALEAVGALAYGQSTYLKSTVNSPTDSEYDPQYEIQFSTAEAISQGKFLRLGSVLFSIRGVHDVTDGFTVAEADAIDDPVVDVTFTDTGTYDPVSDTYGGLPVTTTGVLLDMYKLYSYKTSSDPLNKAGDMTLIVAQSAVTPLVGQAVEANGDWRVESVTAFQDAWNVHLRRI